MKYVVLLTLALCGSMAAAQHAGDVFLEVVNGRIRTGSPAGPERVFASEFGELLPDFSDEPGFDCDPGEFVFPGAVGFTVHGTLKKWDGQTLTSTPPERLEIAGAGVFSLMTPETEIEVQGFTLPVGANGTWHRHYDFTLGQPASDGVYMLELSLWIVGSSERSETFYIVFNQNVSEAEHDDAMDWVRDNLVTPACPADWDRSGGVDSDDVIAFFADWDQSNADFNGDGGTDADDVIAFFSRWDSSC